MAEFQKVAKEFKRMCSEHPGCDGCPFEHPHKDVVCSAWAMRNPKEGEQKIMEWTAKHPIKTNRDKFKEVFGLDYLDPLPGGGIAWLAAEYKGGKG